MTNTKVAENVSGEPNNVVASDVCNALSHGVDLEAGEKAKVHGDDFYVGVRVLGVEWFVWSARTRSGWNSLAVHHKI